MDTTEKCRTVFVKYRGLMRMSDLKKEKIQQYLPELTCVEPLGRSMYRWLDVQQECSLDEVIRRFPNAVLCMDTALRYYGYCDRFPLAWSITVTKNTPQKSFDIVYPLVRPYYVDPTLLELGLTWGEMNGRQVRIYDKERVICDCFRQRARMDTGVFAQVLQSYVRDSNTRCDVLMEYAVKLRVKKLVSQVLPLFL